MMHRFIRLLAVALMVGLAPSCLDGGGSGGGSPGPGPGPGPVDVLISICTDSSSQNSPEIVSDGAGGAIIVWFDARNPTGYHIYAQRIDGTGAVQWTANGAPICTATGSQIWQKVVADGAGGAIIAWQDQRSGGYDVYAQRVNGAGTTLWTLNGVALCTATGDQGNVQVVPDGAGGAVVAWLDARGGTTYGVYAQRVNSLGAPQWTANGVAVCTVASNQSYPQIASDGSGGGIVTWHDRRGGTTSEVYAQRVSGTGAPQWTANGVLLCGATNSQVGPQIVPDGSGGAIVVWEDLRGTSYDVYGQRITGAGALLWTADGLPVCTANGNQYGPQLTGDGSGGALVTWIDNRPGSTYDVYLQRMSSAGAAQWTVDGIAFCTAAGDQGSQHIESDGSGGAIVVWEDYRSGTNYEVYARRVIGGMIPAPNNGKALLSVPHVFHYPKAVPDGSGGAIVTWADARSGANDIFAQRVPAASLP